MRGDQDRVEIKRVIIIIIIFSFVFASFPNLASRHFLFQASTAQTIAKGRTRDCASPWERLVKSMSRDSARDKRARTCLLHGDYGDV